MPFETIKPTPEQVLKVQARFAEAERKWTKIASDLLVGRKIVGVRWMTPKEREGLGWSASAVVIVLDNGVALWPSADDEGNGAGALFSSDKKTGALPVL